MPKRFGKARAKQERFVAKIERENKGQPGFLGACLNFSLTAPDGTVKTFGNGALFIHRGPVPPLTPVEGQNPLQAECAPINPATGEPYFKIPAEGWGEGWSIGALLRAPEVRLGVRDDKGVLVKSCPWCGFRVPEDDDCPQPTDYCHHDMGPR